MENESQGKKINYKLWTSILIALLLMAGGLYLYYFYPEVIPGMAKLSPEEKQKKIQQLQEELEDVSILLMGLDDVDSVAKGEVEVDSLVLVNLKPKEKKILLINIVMDKEGIISQINDVDVDDDTINQVLARVEELTTSKVDYYFTISYQGFENLVNNLGGIEVQLEEGLKVPELELDLKPGLNELNGQESLNYARWYDYQKDEFDRIKRQQQVFDAIGKEAFQGKTIRDIPELFRTTVDTFAMVKTNISYNLMKDLVDFYVYNDNIEIDYSIVNN